MTSLAPPAPDGLFDLASDDCTLPPKPPDGNEHVPGPAPHHLPKRPDELQAPNQQARQHQRQGAEGQRQLLLHGLVGLISILFNSTTNSSELGVLRSVMRYAVVALGLGSVVPLDIMDACRAE